MEEKFLQNFLNFVREETHEISGKAETIGEGCALSSAVRSEREAVRRQ